MNDEAVAQFISFTSSTAERAEQYLRLTDGDVQQAIDLFFANDGNDAYGSNSASAAPAQSAAQSASNAHEQASTSRQRQGYEDEDGVIHIDSDRDLTDDDEPQITGSTSRRVTRPGRPRSDVRTPSSMTPPARTVTNLVDEDEAMARRLQEEFYGDAGAVEELGPDGVRAPLARTTETLVGPESFDGTNRDELREAVLEQMRARQRLQQRGMYLSLEKNLGCRLLTHQTLRAQRDFQPGCWKLNMEPNRRQ